MPFEKKKRTKMKKAAPMMEELFLPLSFSSSHSSPQAHSAVHFSFHDPSGFSFPFPLPFMFPFVSSRIHVCVSHLFFLPPVSVAFSLYPLTCNFLVLLFHLSRGWTMPLVPCHPPFQPAPSPLTPTLLPSRHLYF